MKSETFVCDQEHDSQGLFKNHDFFLKQLKAGALECLTCGRPGIREGLNRPHVNSGVARSKSDARDSGVTIENVGPKLYEKAMAIVAGEEPARPLSGTANLGQIMEIAQSGFAVMATPKYDA